MRAARRFAMPACAAGRGSLALVIQHDSNSPREDVFDELARVPDHYSTLENGACC